MLAKFEKMERPAFTMYYVPEHTSLARDYATAGEKALPLITEWFGTPREKVTVVELPDQLAAPFESGNVSYSRLCENGSWESATRPGSPVRPFGISFRPQVDQRRPGTFHAGY